EIALVGDVEHQRLQWERHRRILNFHREAIAVCDSMRLMKLFNSFFDIWLDETLRGQVRYQLFSPAFAFAEAVDDCGREIIQSEDSAARNEIEIILTAALKRMGFAEFVDIRCVHVTNAIQARSILLSHYVMASRNSTEVRICLDNLNFHFR